MSAIRPPRFVRGTFNQSAKGTDWICMWLSDIPGPWLFIKKLPDTFPERNVSLTTLLRAEKVRKVRRSDRIAFIPITGVKKPLRNSRLLRA